MAVGSVAGARPLERLAIALAPVALAASAAAGAATNTLPLALGASGLFALLLVGLRAPVVVLGLFAALIPFEDALTVGGPGTATAARLVGLVFAVAYVAHRGHLPRVSSIPTVGWAYVLWAVASGAWVLDLGAWGTILTLIQMFVLALLVADLVAHDPGAVRKVMWAYSASAVATVLLFVAAPGFPSGLATLSRAEAFADQGPAHLSAVLLPALLFLVHESGHVAARRDAGRLLAGLVLAGAAVVAWGALASGTRSAMVGMLVGLVVLAATGTGHRGGRIAVAGISLVGVGAALIAPGVVDSVLLRLAGAVATGGAGRVDIWAVGATIFAGHPILGVGYGAFPSAFTADVIRTSALPGFDSGVLLAGRGAHSILVSTAAELGVVGLVLLGAFLWKVLRAHSDQQIWDFVRAAVIAVLAQAMFLDVLERKQLWLLLGAAVGLAAAMHARATDVDASSSLGGAKPAPAGSTARRHDGRAAHVD